MSFIIFNKESTIISSKTNTCIFYAPLMYLFLTNYIMLLDFMGCVKRIWYLSPMRAAKVQASLRMRAVSPEPPLLTHTGNELRGTFRQKARSLAPLNGWACAVKICHDGMLEDTNSLAAALIMYIFMANDGLSIAFSGKIL